MAKAAGAFRTISEAAEVLGVQAHVIRFWETKFTQVKPVKRAGGRRYYRPDDVALLSGIRTLLHDEGMTIKGVQKMMREDGPAAVAAKGAPVDPEDDAVEGTSAAKPDEDGGTDASRGAEAAAYMPRPTGGTVEGGGLGTAGDGASPRAGDDRPLPAAPAPPADGDAPPAGSEPAGDRNVAPFEKNDPAADGLSHPQSKATGSEDGSDADGTTEPSSGLPSAGEGARHEDPAAFSDMAAHAMGETAAGDDRFVKEKVPSEDGKVMAGETDDAPPSRLFAAQRLGPALVPEEAGRFSGLLAALPSDPADDDEVPLPPLRPSRPHWRRFRAIERASLRRIEGRMRDLLHRMEG
ncbi:MerR-like DNA binding protein [Hasllibacter halocynthiae]|uniref:MerR-like DNA binding protein n=1 Tax=Hasllibacter halocynthiae TaxID=595589 RepID=A0A2T0X7G4_9RHOB|nr:MerR family transcriptional regulator [Hasllibacter halocynthiae]PRY94892.1 MerR-like DNA binding protein [Hasllibacter halocynthiae]